MNSEYFHMLDEELRKLRAMAASRMEALLAAQTAARRMGEPFQWAMDGGERVLERSTSKGKHTLRPSEEKDLDAIHASHQRIVADLSSAKQACEQMARLNLRNHLGSVPNWVVRVLQALHAHGVMDYYRVIGTHALYAYEAAANIAFDSAQTATQDIDLLWNHERRIMFIEHLDEFKPPKSMVDVLKTADASFERDEDRKESAINAEGYSVDFLRLENHPAERDAYTISNIEGDVMPVQAPGSDKFMQGPVFRQVVICQSTGEMAMMPTVDPVIFASFKQAMGASSRRDPRKRHRDGTQAAAVVQLLNAGLLATGLAQDQIKAFPVNGLQMP